MKLVFTQFWNTILAGGMVFLAPACGGEDGEAPISMDDAIPVDAAAPADGEPMQDGGLPGTGMEDTPAALTLCQPGPLWLTEGEALQVDIVCPAGEGQAEVGDLIGIEVLIEPLPAGAVYDPATGRLRWTPALDQAAVYELRVSLPARDESAPLTIGVADTVAPRSRVMIVVLALRT